MRGRRQERIEAAVDHVAGALLGGAVAWALLEGLARRLPLLQLVSIAAFAAGLSYFVATRLLRRVEAQRPQFDIPVFRLSDLEVAGLDELLLTEQVELVLSDADRLVTAPVAAAGELVLDDVLAAIDSDARVVRLFDRGAMPTPAQLNARIERHLHGGASADAAPDASHALYEALDELRRSLR